MMLRVNWLQSELERVRRERNEWKLRCWKERNRARSEAVACRSAIYGMSRPMTMEELASLPMQDVRLVLSVAFAWCLDDSEIQSLLNPLEVPR